jgi:hypothetical protein
MPRTTASFDEEQHSWIARMADELDRSQSAVIAGTIDVVRGEDSRVAREILMHSDDTRLNQNASDDTTAILADLRDRVDDLAEQVADLEGAGVDDVEEPDPAGSSPPDDTTESEAASAGAEREEENTTDGSDETPPRAGSGTTDDEGRPDAATDVREQLREELPGSGRRLEARVDAIVAMRDELRERGEAERDELLAAADVEATGYSDANSFWKNAVAGKDTLRALPGVEAPSTGNSVWWWAGGDDDTDVYDPTDEF